MKLKSMPISNSYVVVLIAAVISILVGGFILFSASEDSAYSADQNGHSTDRASSVQSTLDVEGAPTLDEPDQQPDTRENRERLYDSSLPAHAIYKELVELADAGDGRAAFRVVDIDTRCWLATSNAKILDYSMESMSEILTNDPDGRFFFNLSLAFTGSGVSTIDDYTSYISTSKDFCDGFKPSKNTENWLDYLVYAAEDGIAEAQIALWGAPLPQAANSGKEDTFPSDLTKDTELGAAEWNEMKLRYLTEAGESGDPRAWVLLGDAYSGQSPWVTPDLSKAYAYYYLAEGEFEFPFIGASLRSVSAKMSQDEIQIAEGMVHSYKRR